MDQTRQAEDGQQVENVGADDVANGDVMFIFYGALAQIQPAEICI